MAKKAAPRKTNSAKKKPDGGGITPTQIEIALGVGLIVLALVTLLSMVFTRGDLTDAWLSGWRRLLGWAFVVSPLLLGGAGAFLIFDSLDQRPDIGWETVAGVGIVFVALLGLLHMTEGVITRQTAAQLAEAGHGGGYLGLLVSQSLSDALGGIGAALILLGLTTLGVFLAARHTLGDLTEWGRATWTDATDELRRRQVPINRGLTHPNDPFDPDEIPIRSGGRAAPAQPVPPPAPPPYQQPQTLRPPTIIGSEERPAPPPRTTPNSPPAPTVPAASASARSVVPRVLGGARDYRLPPVPDILEDNVEQEVSRDEIRQKARTIEETLDAFGVPARVVEVNQGPAITQFGVEPGYVEKKDSKGQVTRSKVKVNKISALANDLALALAAPTIRIEAPVPGRPIVGIEVPNTKSHVVSLRGVIESESFADISGESRLGLALGQDVSGQPIAVDLTKMPHLLIAGATGSGKSVCINAVIASLLLTHTPQSLRFLMVDPKRVELVQYNGIPHLLTDVVVEMEQVVGVLQLALREMDRRYRLFARAGTRNIEAYNTLAESKGEAKLPYMVIIIDELADLMMVAAEEVERNVVRLAQMARATGIHLILATQRPSVDVVTGLIKANFPARIAFAVTSQIDSRVILDTPGADKLLGRGDMLYMAPDASKLQRLQGCYVSDRELDRLVRYWKGMGPKLSDTRHGLPTSLADEDQAALPGASAWPPAADGPPASRNPLVARTGQPSFPGLDETDFDAIPSASDAPQRDELWDAAIEVVRGTKTASASLLQRKLRIGYQRASRLIEEMEDAGILGPPEGPTKARPVLIENTDSDEADDQW